jgi:hypothetical protein
MRHDSAVIELTARILWVDNDLYSPEIFKRQLEHQKPDCGAAIELVDNAHSARLQIKEGGYSAVVIDLDLGGVSVSEDGGALLSSIATYDSSLPIFVYSANLPDPRYSAALLCRSIVAIEDKGVPLDKNVWDSHFFSQILTTATDYNEIRELFPERTGFSDYLTNWERHKESVSVHWKKHGRWIENEMNKNGYAWCVVCGTSIVKASNSPSTFPGEDALKEIGYSTGLVPFAYTAPMLPEEVFDVGGGSIWSRTNYEGDYYPTVVARIDGVTIVGDFDTGAIKTHQ